MNEDLASQIAKTLAQEVRAFREVFITEYSNPWISNSEARRMADALSIEYGRLLLEKLANPPVVRITGRN